MNRPSRFFVGAPAFGLALACLSVSRIAHAADPATTQTVEQLADKAYALQAEGKFAESIKVYLKTYDISKNPLTLLNIATIYDRRLDEPALASEYYRRYLLSPDPDPERVQKVTERLAVLKREDEEERARPVTALPPVVPPPVAAATTAPPREPVVTSDPSRGAAMRTAGGIIGFIGLAGVGTSIALGYVAKQKNDDANLVCNGLACQSATGVNLAKTAENFATASTAAFVSGLVLLGGGIVLFVTAPKNRPVSTQAASVFLAPRVDATGGGLLLHGTF